MNDMSAVIVAKSDQINAVDLTRREMTVTVAKVDIRSTEQPVTISLQETDKFFRPCKTTCRIMVKAWGPDASKYVGRSMTLYCDPDVKWAGVKVGGIRISAMSHIDAPIVMALAESKAVRKVVTVEPLKQDDEPKVDAAAKWANDFTAHIATLETADDLAAFEAKQAKALAKLESRDDLHAGVMAAIKARYEALAPIDDMNDAPFDDETGEVA